jgi:hypothetical protein
MTILCSALNSGVSLKRLDRLRRKGATKPIGVAVGIANGVAQPSSAFWGPADILAIFPLCIGRQIPRLSASVRHWEHPAPVLCLGE